MKKILMVLSLLLVSSTPNNICDSRPYEAKIIRWIDGDTAIADIDLGWDVTLKEQKLRLNRVDTPERGEPKYKEATNIVKAKCKGYVEVYNCGKGSYGRWLVEMNCNGESINNYLLRRGWKYER